MDELTHGKLAGSRRAGRETYRTVLAAALWVGAMGCGYGRGFTRYTPAPLAPATERTAEFTARALTDPRLDTLLRAAGAFGGSQPVPDPRGLLRVDSTRGRAWDPRALGIAAVFFNPELDTARAGLRVRRAAVLTARQRPQPGVNASLSNAGPGTAAGASFAQALTTTFTIETGGKRAARTDSAQAGVLATELRVRALGWRVAFDAQDAAMRARAADLIAGDARTEQDLLAGVLTLLRARYAEGSASASDLARTESDLQAAVLAVTLAAQTQVALRDSLARALGVPVSEARMIQLTPPAPDESPCAALDTLPPGRLQPVALQRRYDLGAALGDYAAAEADVRLQVAQQYPDVAFGPGLTFAPGALQWIIAAGLPSLVLNRNRGPIAEAQARRIAAARRAEQVQQQVLRDLAAARLECQGATRQVAAADSLARASDLASRLAGAAFNRGEIGRTEVALARLTAFRASRARRTAQERADLAGVLLERAVGAWLSTLTLPDAAVLQEPRAPETSAAARSTSPSPPHR